MRTVAHVMGPGIVAHLADVALERIEIEDQARRLDPILGHAGNGRDIISDLATGEFGSMFMSLVSEWLAFYCIAQCRGQVVLVLSRGSSSHSGGNSVAGGDSQTHQKVVHIARSSKKSFQSRKAT